MLKNNTNEDKKFSDIQNMLKKQNLNPKNICTLKYLLSMTLSKELIKFNNETFLLYLLKFRNQKNEFLFKEYLFQVCELSRLNYIQILLKNGISVNSQNELGETPLHIAIVKNNLELINLLIKYEPDLTLRTKADKSTVMKYSEIYGNKKVKMKIKDLIESKKEK